MNDTGPHAHFQTSTTTNVLSCAPSVTEVSKLPPDGAEELAGLPLSSSSPGEPAQRNRSEGHAKTPKTPSLTASPSTTFEQFSPLLQRLRTLTDALFGGNTEEKERTPLMIKVRVIEPTRPTSHVRTASSIASLIFGKSSHAESFIFSCGARDMRCVAVLWALWFVGAVTGFLIITDHVPHEYAWICTAMLPLPFVGFLVLSKDIVGEVLREMEYYIISVLEVVWVLCAMNVLGDNRRMVWMCHFPSFVLSGLMDAYPAKYRTYFSKLFFVSSALILIAWDVMLMFSLCRWHNTSYRLGDIAGSLAGCTFTTSLTLLCFYARHIYVAFFKPDMLVIVRSGIRTYIDEVRMETHSDDECGTKKQSFTRVSNPRESLIKMRSSTGHEAFRSGGSLSARQPSPNVFTTDLITARSM